MNGRELLEAVKKCIRVDAEELRTWRDLYPKRAADIRELAKTKVENRDPKFDPPRAYG